MLDVKSSFFMDLLSALDIWVQFLIQIISLSDSPTREGNCVSIQGKYTDYNLHGTTTTNNTKSFVLSNKLPEQEQWGSLRGDG